MTAKKAHKNPEEDIDDQNEDEFRDDDFEKEFRGDTDYEEDIESEGDVFYAEEGAFSDDDF